MVHKNSLRNKSCYDKPMSILSLSLRKTDVLLLAFTLLSITMAENQYK